MNPEKNIENVQEDDFIIEEIEQVAAPARLGDDLDTGGLDACY